MEPLNDCNTMFQAGDAMVGYLHVEMERILRKFMGKFVKTSVITASASITEVNFMSPENQHDNSLLAVGMEARRFVHNNPDDISPTQLSSFFRSVRSFYEEVTAKMLAKFPFNDQTLKALGYLNPERRLEISVEAVLQLSDRLVTATDKQCQLEYEFRDFQLSPASDLPSFTQGETPLDVFWVDMSRVSTPLKKPRFPNLVKLSMAALSLPHSNADLSAVSAC